MIRIEIEKKDGEEPTLKMNVKNENTLEIVFFVLLGAIMALENIPGIDLKRAERREMMVEAFRRMLETKENEENEENA